MPSKSAKQAKFMRAVAHSPKFAKKVGVAQSVGKDFEMADKKKKVRKFAAGGADRYQARYDRKVADIESDYKKAQARKKGRAADVAKAKYEQRMADAKDDLAKWTKGDRTETRAAEKAAERNLSLTRKVGPRSSEAIVKKADEDFAAKMPMSSVDLSGVAKPNIGTSFASAFRTARNAGDKTFTWNGKSYTTRMANEPAPRRAASSGSTSRASTSAAKPATTTTSNTATATRAGATQGRAQQTTQRATPARTAEGYKPSEANKQADRMRAEAAATRKQAMDKKDYSGSAIGARLSNMLGIPSSREASANTLDRQDQTRRWREVEAQGARDAAERQKADKRAARVAAGNKPNATSTEKFYAKYPDAMKKGGRVKKYDKGGSAKTTMPREPITGGADTVPLTPERRKFLKEMERRNKEQRDEAVRTSKKATPYAKGGSAMKSKMKMADKAGRAMTKKSADTMGRAMVKMNKGGKCYASGGLVSGHKSADGIAKKGKTRGKMC